MGLSRSPSRPLRPGGAVEGGRPPFYPARRRRARLPGAVLVGAKLRGESFYLADLRSADLAAAVLVGAKMAGADLSGANLAGATLDALGCDVGAVARSRRDPVGRGGGPGPTRRVAR